MSPRPLYGLDTISQYERAQVSNEDTHVHTVVSFGKLPVIHNREWASKLPTIDDQ